MHAYSQSLEVGLNFVDKQKTYPCFAYVAYQFEKNPEILDTIFVTDFETKQVLDPKKSYFVLNSKYKSTCSKYPIVAFLDENKARAFTKRYDGSVRDFDFALFVAQKDLSSDGKIIEQRESLFANKGKVLFEKYCKNNVQNCKNLNTENTAFLEAYLKNPFKIEKNVISKIEVPQEAKCQVCGMFVAKYPKWATQITFKDGHNYYFDGVKDMMKFYFEPEKFHGRYTKNDIQFLFVSDYYSLENTPAEKAFFVVGSNVYGPMGHELIPFKNGADAKEFQKAHLGKMILQLNEITPNILHKLDR